MPKNTKQNDPIQEQSDLENLLEKYANIASDGKIANSQKKDNVVVVTDRVGENRPNFYKLVRAFGLVDELPDAWVIEVIQIKYSLRFAVNVQRDYNKVMSASGGIPIPSGVYVYNPETSELSHGVIDGDRVVINNIDEIHEFHVATINKLAKLLNNMCDGAESFSHKNNWRWGNTLASIPATDMVREQKQLLGQISRLNEEISELRKLPKSSSTKKLIDDKLLAIEKREKCVNTHIASWVENAKIYRDIKGNDVEVRFDL